MQRGYAVIGRMPRHALTAIAFVLSAACARSIDAEADRLCTPGNYVFCRCKDRSEGTKLCSADGFSFGACDACDNVTEEVPVPPTPEDPPDSSIDEPDAEKPPPPAPIDGGGDEDAATVVVAKPIAGDVLITEVMYDPSGTEPDQEWIELFNTTTSLRLLDGLVLKDGGNRSHVIGGSPKLIIPPKAYVVLARNRSAAAAAHVPAASIVYEYGGGATTVIGGILLANGATGGISLVDGTTTIAAAFYGGWFVQVTPGGKSIQLKELTFAGGGSKTSWCLSAAVFAGGVDFGTPGGAADCF